MDSTITTPRNGRRTAIALGVAAAIAVVVLGWLGAPLAVDEWWIRKLRSQDEAEVLEAIDKIDERKIVRAAPALLSIIGGLEDPLIDRWGFPFYSERPPVGALLFNSLMGLDRPPEWCVSRIERGSATERRAAIYWAGAMGWEVAVPALRGVVEGNGPLAPVAALALARILPVIRVEPCSIEEGSSRQPVRRIHLRFTNSTGRTLWFRGTSSVRPIVMRSNVDPIRGWWEGPAYPLPSGLGPREFPADSSFVVEDVDSTYLPGTRFSFYLSYSASSVPLESDRSVNRSWDAVIVESEVLEPEKA